MIGRVLFYIVGEVVGTVVDGVARGALDAMLPRRRRAPERSTSKRVIVSAGAMFDRAALYEAWGEAHGLAWMEARGKEYVGTYRGRTTEMLTGLVDTPLPKSPELLVRIALEGVEATTLLERGAEASSLPVLRALASLLEVEGVRDVAVTRAFVRLRFDPFVETAVLDDAVTVLDAVLESISPRTGAAPFR